VPRCDVTDARGEYTKFPLWDFLCKEKHSSAHISETMGPRAKMTRIIDPLRSSVKDLVSYVMKSKKLACASVTLLNKVFRMGCYGLAFAQTCLVESGHNARVGYREIAHSRQRLLPDDCTDLIGRFAHQGVRNGRPAKRFTMKHKHACQYILIKLQYSITLSSLTVVWRHPRDVPIWFHRPAATGDTDLSTCIQIIDSPRFAVGIRTPSENLSDDSDCISTSRKVREAGARSFRCYPLMHVVRT
jgi:hypothetical protein